MTNQNKQIKQLETKIQKTQTNIQDWENKIIEHKNILQAIIKQLSEIKSQITKK